MIKTPVMIIGAGPTGLMMSAQLHRFGCDHIIVDKKPGITHLSKALGVQARTMEFYQQLDLVEKALDIGYVAGNVLFIVNGRNRVKIPLSDIGKGLSPFPYLFILEQSENERLLADFISHQGGEIRWHTEAGDFRVAPEGYTGTLTDAEGNQETFACDYLVGCAGAGSTVRDFLGLEFAGETNEQLFFVADAILDMPLAKEGLVLAINNHEFLGFFPMAGEGRYRVIGILPESIRHTDAIPEAELARHIETHFHQPLKVKALSWTSAYRVHHRIADTFRRGNAFVLGDEAHIHSPAGGQGMNTGLGDAVNLGWKLSAVCQGWAPATILDSYDAERRPFGQQLVKTTDRGFATIVSQRWWARFFRLRILPLVLGLLVKSHTLRRLLFKTISQTRIHYRNSPLSDGSTCNSLKSGDRFPWFEWAGGNSFSWFRKPGFVELIFGDASPVGFPDWQGPCLEVRVSGDAAQAAQAAGLPARGTVQVRPDMHIYRIHAA